VQTRLVLRWREKEVNGRNMIGITILSISIIVIYSALALTFSIGLIKHFICLEWEDIPMSLLGTAVFVGIALLFLDI